MITALLAIIAIPALIIVLALCIYSSKLSTRACQLQARGDEAVQSARSFSELSQQYRREANALEEKVNALKTESLEQHRLNVLRMDALTESRAEVVKSKKHLHNLQVALDESVREERRLAELLRLASSRIAALTPRRNPKTGKFTGGAK